MRDINRIDNFLSKVGEEWKKVPDWRFGQLMYNLMAEKGDPFNWEENMFAEKLKEFIEDVVLK